MPNNIKPAIGSRPVDYTPPPSSSLENVLVDGNDAALRQVIHHLFSAGDMLREFREIMGQSIGLTGRQYQIMMAIGRLQNGVGVPIKELAVLLRVVPSHVTVEVAKLVQRGYVEKLPNVDDRRSVLVALTVNGCSVIEAVTPLVRDINDDLFDRVSRPEFLNFKDIMENFVDNADIALATARYKNEISKARPSLAADKIKKES